MASSAAASPASPPPSPASWLRNLTSLLVQRMQFAREAGLTFKGKRRLDTALGYLDELKPDDYRYRFTRNEIAGRIVETYPKATWRGGGELVEDEDPDVETAFEEQWAALDQRLKIWSTLQRADILAGLGRYAVVLIGAPGGLETPIERLTSEALVFLQPYSERHAAIERLVADHTNPRFGLPEFYTLTMAAGSTSQTQARRVHHSRVLHIADGTVEDPIYGTPRLERVWNRIDDLEKVVGGGAEAFYRRAHQGTQIDVDPETVMKPEDWTALETQVDEYVHDMRRTMQTRGVKVTSLGSDVAMFDKNVDSILLLISAGTAIPHRILTGSERGELASTQDRNNWNERISDRRTDFAEHRVVRPLVDRLIGWGTLPEPAQYDIRWPEVKNLDDEERATTAVKWAEINHKAGETVVTTDEIRDRVLGLPPLDEVEGDSDEPDEAETDPAESRGAASAPAPWRAVHKAADAHLGRMRRTWMTAWDASRNRVSLSQLEQGFAADDRQRVEADVREAIDEQVPDLTDEVQERLLAALIAGGNAAARSAKSSGSFARPRVSQIGQAFDRTNPEAERWAASHAATLVSNATEDTKAAIRAIIARAFDDQLTPREAAKLIRSVVGLTEGQATAVINLRARLLESKPGSLVRAGRVKIRIPEAGASAELVQRHVRQYADRLLRQRALGIARTETLAASNEGQRQLWLQAVRRGDIAITEKREWITTPDERLCPLCAPMDGQRRGLDEPFESPSGQHVMGPPLHPQCRCATGLTPPATSQPRGSVHAT